jgi:hypothetical protein
MRKLLLAIVFVAGLVDSPTAALAGDENGNHAAYAWVLGTNTSMAPDGSTITMTGSGTLRAGHRGTATGGGTYTKSGGESGTWTVTAIKGFVSYGLAGPEPFPLPPGATGGQANLRVALSNGQKGVLTIFCVLGSPPPSTMEGIKLVLGRGESGERAQSGEYTRIVAGNTVFIAIRQGDGD